MPVRGQQAGFSATQKELWFLEPLATEYMVRRLAFPPPPPLPPPVSVGGFLGSIWKLALEFCCSHTLSHEGWLADTNQLEYVLEQHSVNVRFVPQDLSRTASEHKQIPDSAMPSQHSRTSTQQHNTISLLSRSKTPDK